MENIIDKKICTGCTACLSICPKKAISFKEDRNYQYLYNNAVRSLKESSNSISNDMILFFD